MPTLNWLGKDKVINHHKDVPFHVLEKKYHFSKEGKENSDELFGIEENKIIHGDNLLALKSLLPMYEGRVKCIYIDPPYNTGEEKWVYNDNVNDPRIKKWLGEVVGKQGEDLSRDDKWLCMMYPRLKLLRQLLSEDGVIFISIDDNEQANLKILCDEIFGAKNFVGQWNWFKSATPPNLSHKIKKNVEYILAYEKCKNNSIYRGRQKYSPSDDPLIKPQNTVKSLTFPPGTLHFKTTSKIITKGIYGTKKYPNELLNDIEIEDGTNKNSVSFRNRFIWIQNKLYEEIANKTQINCSNRLVLSYKKSSYDPEVPPNFIDDTVGVATTEEAGKLLLDIFDEKVFDYPKPPSLIKYLVSFISSEDSIILDSFAGSGTTAHAVMELNKEDGGKRKFILIEMMDYAESITAERVRRVINGYKNAEGMDEEFSYYELGEPLFKEDGNLNEDIGEEKIREYILYSELGISNKHLEFNLQNISAEKKSYLLGNYNNTGYYFYYEKDRLTELDIETLSSIIEDKQEQYIIYADVCTLSEQIKKKHNIIFKKIPRDIRKF